MTFRRDNDNPIAKRRYKLGISQRDLAARVGVVIQTVSKWECGEDTVSDGNLRALAKIFGVTAGTLFNELDAWRRA